MTAATMCGETHPHDRHEFLVGFRRHDCPGAQGCTGSRFCEADVHVHGCFADGGNCDEPAEHYDVGRRDGVSAATRYEEGDRCIGCGHWYWRDGHWHSLVPITYADTPELAREAECPTCEGGE